MGTYEAGTMTKEVKDGLDAALKFSEHDFDYMQDVEFYEHNFGIILDEIRKAESEALAEFGKLGIDKSVIQNINKYASGLGSDKFFYTHILDVIYYGLTFWGERLRSHFIDDLITKMLASKKTGQKVHVLGYSLGTALINDSFSKIYRSGEVDDKHLSTAHHKVDHYWSIANVSRILHEFNDIDGANPNSNVVHDGVGGCVKKMTLASHKYDPFMLVKPYARQPENGRFHHPSGITKINTHDLTGYLSDPDIGLRLIADIYGGDSGINADVLRKGKNNHIKATVNNDIDGLGDKWQQVIDSLNDPSGAANSVKVLIAAVDTFREKIKTLIDEVKPEGGK
jgi:hypothetical protein